MGEFPFVTLIADDLERVETLLRRRHSDSHESIHAAVTRLVGGGGKRLRPALVLLSARLCGAEMARAVYAAAAVEMLHTATLVHDDLIDGAPVRRGADTLNAHWSPAATVLTGDYVFAYAAYLAAQTGNIHLMHRFAETLMVICNGEVRQMFDGRRRIVAYAEYERRIYAKTASLMEMSAEAGAILAASDDAVRAALRAYGERLGLAFQIVDDVLDFTADEETLGKPVGGDLRQGLVTLPLILFLKAQPDHPAVRCALEGNPSPEVLQEAVRAVAASPAIEQAMAVARQRVDEAKAALLRCQLRRPDAEALAALRELADFTVRRRF